MQVFLQTYLPEFFYILCGIVCFDCAYRARLNKQARVGTILFWGILGTIFAFGKLIPANIIGILLVVMGCLTVSNQVKMGEFEEASENFKLEQSKKLGNKIFIPAVTIGIVALILSFVKYPGIMNGKKIMLPLDGAVMSGLACVIALIVAIIFCKPKISETRSDTSRLLMQVGASCLLPQLLGALGTLFNEAKVGDVIAHVIESVIPSGNIVIGVIVYVLAMVIFTMIMGNAFAAFTVITIGIGIPFVINQGGDPAIIASLGMTAGYCGTLMTPMAANFNIVSCVVLETKDKKWAVIKEQVPMAITLIVIHIILMLVLGF